MEQVVYFASALLVLGVVIRLAILKRRSDEAVREAQFRHIMLSLEEKAKKEGTFVISYFDGENDKRA